MGEGAIAPIVMIRRGDLKFVHSPVDPDQLYDLVGRPARGVNLAEDSDWAVRLKELRAEVDRRWDLDELHAEVLADQARRRLVGPRCAPGKVTPWEYTPAVDGRPAVHAQPPRPQRGRAGLPVPARHHRARPLPRPGGGPGGRALRRRGRRSAVT